MRIAICGCGVVGRATGEGFARLGHEVYAYDINPEAARVPWGDRLEKPVSPEGCDVVFFCTPEDRVAEAVTTWAGLGALVVRSSTPPGTIQELSLRIKRGIKHNPEWLREAIALHDFLNPRFILIGVPHKGGFSKSPRPLSDLYKPLNVPIITTDTTTSEMVKLATNGLLATLVAYWMDIHHLCQALGVNSHEVGMIASLDPRVPAYGARQHGQRYGGRCLPKDIQQLLTLAQRHLGQDVTSEVPVLAGVSKWSE